MCPKISTFQGKLRYYEVTCKSGSCVQKYPHFKENYVILQSLVKAVIFFHNSENINNLGKQLFFEKFEKLFLIRLKPIVASKSLVSNHQFGFREKH